MSQKHKLRSQERMETAVQCAVCRMGKGLVLQCAGGEGVMRSFPPL